MNNYEDMLAEKIKLQREMDDEVTFVKMPYLKKIKMLDQQMAPRKKGQEKRNVAKNVKKYKGRF